MSTSVARAEADWLSLREHADSRARATGLVEELRRRLSTSGGLRVHDLGSGTGSMRRWLAPQLPAPQHWIEHDRDADLLARNRAEAVFSADGAPVTVETRCAELASLQELEGASLVTASALLDVLTDSALTALVEQVRDARVPCLLTLSVVGRVEIWPSDPRDVLMQNAFNDHQRRDTDIGRLLGPDAVGLAVERLRLQGLTVRVQESPWVLGPSDEQLLMTWFDEWVDAACEQDRTLRAEAAGYRSLRHQQKHEGALTAAVHHIDVLAWPT